MIIALTTGLVHIMLSHFYYEQPSERLPSVFKAIFISVLLFSPMAVAILAILNRNLILASDLRQVNELNQLLTEKLNQNNPEEEGRRLILTGATRDTVELRSADLLYMEAYGNYVRINYHSTDGVKQKLLRATIKQIEESLQNDPAIVRCHRAFIVNVTHIVHVEGNLHGYKLKLRYTNDEIPVSRGYTKNIKEQISFMGHSS